MPDTSTRLPGHGLQGEGIPFERGSEDQEKWIKVWGSWAGCGVCSCGEASPVLPSNNARKRWHREVHKPEVRARMARA